VTSLSIAAAGERTGVSPHTLRYYERIGLIDPVGRDEGGRRVYREADLALLEDHRRRVLHDLEHLNDCLGSISYKIDRYRRSNA
jgi:DNA-binding transcriptional MerR regulator